MKRRFTSIFHRSGERGIALILTLAIITLVTLILIAFAVSMRVENTASKSFNDLIMAREIAQGAVDQAVATIRQATPQRTQSPVSTYVTSPGLIYTNFNGLFGSISLTSPSNTSYSASIGSVNLNAGFWITGSNNVEYTDPVASAIPVGWVYVATNGSLSPPNASLNYPLVGRFAFWVDDEASKININTAFQRPAVSPDPVGYSTNGEVDLRMLWPGLNLPAAIQTRQAPSGPGYTTIEEVKLVDPSAGPNTPDSDFNTNRFYLTTYSNDANYPNYTDDLDALGVQRRLLSDVNETVDIKNTPATNISAVVRLSDNALKQVYSSSGTFADKYPVVSGVDGFKQIIANIIAYQADPTTTPPPDGGGNPPVYLGLGKTPYINELRIRYDIQEPTPGNFTVTRTVSAELFYQYDGTYTPGTEQIIVTNLPDAGGLFSPGPVTITPPGGVYTGPTYRQCDAATEPAVALTVSTVAIGTQPQITYTRDYSGAKRLDYAEANVPRVTLQKISGAGPFYQDSQVNDPAVNDTFGQWTGNTGVGTMGAQNSTYIPPETPPSKVVIRGAAMQSIGELGYIHTPLPWQYIRLQSQLPADKPSIPDWAILDAFAVSGSTPGRININSSVYGLSAGRQVPLKALLNNVALAAAGNIYSGIYVTSDTFGNTTAYDTIGEICEVQGVDDIGATEAVKEETIRRIANIITVRSSTFTIWVMAQSIKQPPTTPTIGLFTPGVDLITGEVRAQAVVERYEDPPGSAPKFRVRYFRYLYN